MTSKANRSRGMPRRSTPASSGSSRTPLFIGAAVIAVVLVAAVVAIALNASGGGGDLAEPATTPIGVAGTPLPALTDPTNDPAVGRPIPTLTGTDLSGAPITIGPEGGAQAIVIVAHWCPHCQAELPLLVDYLESTGMPDGVELVAVSTSIDPVRPNYPPSAWLEGEGWTAPTLVDDADSTALAALGMSNFPGFVFVDADGEVFGRITGEIPMATFDEIVNSLAP